MYSRYIDLPISITDAPPPQPRPTTPYEIFLQHKTKWQSRCEYWTHQILLLRHNRTIAQQTRFSSFSNKCARVRSAVVVSPSHASYCCHCIKKGIVHNSTKSGFQRQWVSLALNWWWQKVTKHTYTDSKTRNLCIIRYWVMVKTLISAFDGDKTHVITEDKLYSPCVTNR